MFSGGLPLFFLSFFAKTSGLQQIPGKFIPENMQAFPSPFQVKVLPHRRQEVFPPENQRLCMFMHKHKTSLLKSGQAG